MEHIKEILERQTRINTSKGNTGTWSSAEPAVNSGEETCPTCKGAKFVYPRLPSGKPDYSHVVPCKCAKNTSAADRRERLQNYSHLGLLARLTFSNINPQKNSDPDVQAKFSRAFEAAKSFAFEPKGWLVLAGPSGSGKTHLAAAIANQCIEENRPVFYVTVPDLLDHLRSTFSPSSETPYDEFFEQVRSAPLLVLDDLGIQSSTAWAKEKLDQLLNHRFSNQLPTVIVSIVPIDELEERIRTRLTKADFCSVFTLGKEPAALSTLSWDLGFELQKQMTFKSFDSKRSNLPEKIRQNLEMVFNAAVEFAKSPEGWLIFMGDNGCGKTHLAAAIVNYRYAHGQPAVFVVVPDFLDYLRSAFTPENKASYDQIFESVKKSPLLVLDDLGQQSTTAWAQEKLFQVLNYRYNARLATVVTTNCSMEQLTDSISSRFADQRISNTFAIVAPHYFAGENRPRKKNSRNREN